MLNTDDKLRFLGIDLRSRARRRCVVVLTYLAYLLAETWITKESIPNLQSDESRWYLASAISVAVILFGVFREGGPVKPLLDVRWRAEWRGKHKSLYTPPIELDERELVVRDRAVRRTLEAMIVFCFICALPGNNLHTHTNPIETAQVFMMLMVFGATWPKAIILWRERDPRTEEDSQLVQQRLT